MTSLIVTIIMSSETMNWVPSTTKCKDCAEHNGLSQIHQDILIIFDSHTTTFYKYITHMPRLEFYFVTFFHGLKLSIDVI